MRGVYADSRIKLSRELSKSVGNSNKSSSKLERD